MATIKDVAKRAGVSVATVSRVINGTGQIRKATAERVLAAVRDLGFRPSAVGRSLSTSHTKSLGVVIPSMSNPVFADAVAGINEEARSRGYTLMFTSTEYNPEEEVRAVSTFLDYRVDGLILTVADPRDSAVLELLERAGVPYVLIYNQVSVEGRSTVTIDNVAAGRAVAEALFDLGHETLGMVSGLFYTSDRAMARRDGFVQAVRAKGYPDPTVLEVGFVDLEVEKALRDIYGKRETAPSALFCSNDLLAISVIGALGRIGLTVPDDVSVIGFDGIAIGTHLHPTLATVVQPSREMGQAATRLLLDRLNGQKKPEALVLPHSLRLGESAGPAAKPSPADLQETIQTKHRRSAS